MGEIGSIGQSRPPELIPLAGKPPAAGALHARFADALSDALGHPRGLTFSAHARQRLEERGIEIGPAESARLEQALDEAALKGARESLLILDSAALVVSVLNRRVITVMAPNPASNTVITNIDSVVMVGE